MASKAAVLVIGATTGFATLDPDAVPREIAAPAPCHIYLTLALYMLDSLYTLYLIMVDF